MAKKNSADGIMELKKELAQEKLRPIYLFYGEESYIKSTYEKRITDMIPDGGFPEFNHLKFEGTDTPLSDYDDAWEGFPMMTDKKLIIIRDSKIFKKANEETKEFWVEKFKRVSEDNVVIFNETEVDKRGVLYKALQKVGFAVEFNYQSEADLITWVNRQALNEKIKMSKDVAAYLVGSVDPGLSNLTNEFNKLISFCGDKITKSDVDRVVSKSMSIKIFDLTDAIMKRNPDTAMKVVSELRTSSESAFGILYLLESSAEKILKTKLTGSRNKYEVASAVGVAPFIADKYIASAAGFSTEALIRMITRIPEIDFEIKSGLVEQWAALECYIAESING